MKILSIDPGYDRMGVAVIDCSAGVGKEEVLFSECFLTDKEDSFPERVVSLIKKIKTTIKKYKPETLALESLFLSSNQKTAMRVAEVRGALILVAAEKGLSIYEYSPPQIKLAITGNGRASKKNIEEMVPRLINFNKKDILDDELDAIAVGLTHSAIYRNI